MANKHGFRANKYELITKQCPGYKNMLNKKDPKCKGYFSTRDPSKIFCSERCRIKIWTRNNRDKVNIIQKEYRNKQKKKFDRMVQDILDSKGVQEN